MNVGRTVTVASDGETHRLPVGPGEAASRLSEFLRAHDLPLNTRCAQRGICRGCEVRVVTDDGVETVKACQTKVGDLGEVAIEIPRRSLLAGDPQVVVDFTLRVTHALDPLCDVRGGVERPMGLAVDVGTTTVAAVLVDLRSGDVVADATGFNRQMHVADDVVSRIDRCTFDPEGVQELRRLLIEGTLGPLVSELLSDTELTKSDIGCTTVSGNTTMLHLFAGVDPSPMGSAPFEPEFIDHRVLSPGDDDLLRDAVGDGDVHLLPGASAYVGADIVAGVTACGMLYDGDPSLLVDIGTNGEIVLQASGSLFGCSTAAGPAFEGAGLRSGVRAMDGAVGHLAFEDGELRLAVIGDRRPVGICGTGYVDFLAQGRSAGVLSPIGRLVGDRVIPGDDGGGSVFPIARGLGRNEIVISEDDVASLLQAKAAIAAGIVTLMKERGITPDDIGTLYVAGGFGLHLDVENTIACGLLPGFTADQIEVVGNTSLAGAYLALIDAGALDEMSRSGERIDVIELNLVGGFEDTYIDELMLP